MTSEKPKNEELQQTVISSEPQKEQELSEDEQQSAFENRCREKFIQERVMSSELTSEQKVVALKHIQSKMGAWCQYNGTDFKVVEEKVEDGKWKVSFGVFFDDYEAQRIDTEIPLSE
jgi:hypothetical protein